jgi:hypothetical protein
MGNEQKRRQEVEERLADALCQYLLYFLCPPLEQRNRRVETLERMEKERNDRRIRTSL